MYCSTYPRNSCPNKEHFCRSYFEATYAVDKYIQNESLQVWSQDNVYRPAQPKTSFKLHNSWEGTEASYYWITQRTTLMYSLGLLQRSLFPLGLSSTLQLNRETSAQTSPKLVESQMYFHSTYSTDLVFLKVKTHGKKKEPQWDPGNSKNGHRSHNTLFTFTCNH